MSNLCNFFSHNFAIRQQDLTGLLQLIAPCLMAGNPKAAEEILDDEESLQVQLVSLTQPGQWEIDDPEAPQDSIGLITLSGFLYSNITDQLIAALGQLDADRDVIGVLLAIDGPGGHATRVELAAEKIRSMSKPVVTWIGGMMCSAHFWIGSAAREIWAGSALCQAGSVGVLTQYVGLRDYFRKMGVDYREIYPDTSDLKNRESRAIADADDEAPMKATLQRLHEEFARSAAAQLGVNYDPSAELFRGKVFFADEAVEAGWLTGICSAADALRRVYAMGLSNTYAN